MGAKLLREFMPHRHDSVAITVEERAAGLPGDAECPVSYYCITGCCQQTIL